MIEYVGASVTGPANSARKRLKQDAWGLYRRSWGTLAVVCDGLGSKKYSRQGAMAACLAVRDAVASLHDIRVVSEYKSLPEKVWKAWLDRLGALDPDECMTTCLFVLKTDYGWFGAQLGDGFLGFLTVDERLKFCEPDPLHTFNLTSALSQQNPANAWRILEPHAEKAVKGAVLATDGVSDDIRPDSYVELLGDLIKEYQSLNQITRYNNLRNELITWETPHHLDDKTLVVLWEKA